MSYKNFYSILSKNFPFNPTIKQDAFFQKIAVFITNTSNDSIFVLKGYAGTGKTTTLGKFLEWLYSDGGFNNVAMSSPTHKALKVMMEMCPSENKSKVCFTTLHSLLGLKHQITKDGKEVFVKDKKIMSKFPFFAFY